MVGQISHSQFLDFVGIRCEIDVSRVVREEVSIVGQQSYSIGIEDETHFRRHFFVCGHIPDDGDHQGVYFLIFSQTGTDDQRVNIVKPGNNDTWDFSGIDLLKKTKK